MILKDKSYIVGIYEHPVRRADDLSVMRLHADVARGALADAGLSLDDVDGYWCAGDAPGLGAASVIEYMGMKNIRHIDTTESGGSAPIIHVAHAAQAIANGLCNVALITLAGRPKAAGGSIRLRETPDFNAPEIAFEMAYGLSTHNMYAMVAKRHMHEFGTTSEQLAWIKVAASQHAQHNPNAVLKKTVTVDDVLNSPMVSDPLHRLDCCVVSDGGGAIILARPEIAKKLNKPLVTVLGCGEAPKNTNGGKIDLTWSAAAISGPRAFEMANIKPADIDYVSLYDSFTITALIQIEDLGFCEKGAGGRFVMDGNLISGIGKLPFNTDGGGLCNNHPSNRGGMTKIIESVRQLRGEAHPKVQVADCSLALASGIGGSLATRHTAATVILERIS